MKLQVLATRDIMANVYGMPMFVPHIGHSIRSFADECQNKDPNPNNVLGKHPEHFELWHIGEYDDETGIYTSFPIEDRKQLAVGANYKNIN